MVNKMRYTWILFALILVAGTVYFYHSDSHKEKKYHVIFIPKIIDVKSDFWILLTEGVELAAAENNIAVTIVGPESEDDYEYQNELIEWAIEQRPDAILLCPSNYTRTTEYARKINNRGIPLVLIDSALDEDIGQALIATDNVRLGEIEGKFMKQFVRADSKIAIIGHVQNSSTAIQREAGVRKGLAEFEDKIVEVVFCDSDYDKAYDLMEELMEKYPDIDLVAGLNEYSAIGAARAIKDNSKKGQIKVVGIDSSLEEIQLLEEGIFEGIVIQNPFKMGYMGMETTARILKGEKVLKNIDSGCELITKDSVYTEENQKLLFPFKEE